MAICGDALGHGIVLRSLSPEECAAQQAESNKRDQRIASRLRRFEPEARSQSVNREGET